MKVAGMDYSGDMAATPPSPGTGGGAPGAFMWLHWVQKPTSVSEESVHSV
jgi:hypothetical protein